MGHFSTLLCILALGLVFEMGTSCTKQTLPTATSNTVVNKDFKVVRQDSTTTQPSTEHHCGNSQGNQG
jgi:hypothetical protein